MVEYHDILNRVRKAVGYASLFVLPFLATVACDRGTPIQPTPAGSPRSSATIASPNLAFYNPEGIKEGIVQVVNNGEGPAEAYTRGGLKTSFGVYITIDGVNQLGYSVRKEEGRTIDGRWGYPEGSNVLLPGEVSLKRDIPFPRNPGKYKVRVSINPFCSVNESTRSDNNYELDIEVSEDGKAKIIQAYPLQLSEFQHCTERYSWSDDIERSTAFDEWREKGEVELVRTVNIDGRKVNLWIHRGEQNPAGLFEEHSINTQEFLDRVQAVFSKTIPYTDRVTGTSLPEYNIVVTRGEPRNGFSEAYKKTNVIGINAERWHRRTEKGNGKEHLPVTSASHEDYHLRNYTTDPDESEFGREFSAIIHEAGTLANVFNRKRLEKDLAHFTEVIRNEHTDLMDLSDQYVRRALAYHTALRVLDSKGLHALEELSKQLLADSDNGIISFDNVSRRMNLGFTFEGAWSGYRNKLN